MELILRLPESLHLNKFWELGECWCLPICITLSKTMPFGYNVCIKTKINNYPCNIYKLTLEEDLIDLKICAALSGKIIQNAFLAQHRPQARHSTRYPSDFCALDTRSVHSFQECRLRLAGTSAKWLNTISTAWISSSKQAYISCNGVF